MLHSFAPSCLPSITSTHPLPVSPLYPLDEDISGIDGTCSNATYAILRDMHELTKAFLARWNYIGGPCPRSSDTGFAEDMEKIHKRLLNRPSFRDDVKQHWIYESCRLAALIYCRSILHGMPLADSANAAHAESPAGTNSSKLTIKGALRHALESTDRWNHWGNMSGVFLWVCLIGGAGSIQDRSQEARINKCFALYAMQCAIVNTSKHANAMIESQRTMLWVQHLTNLKCGILSLRN